MLKETKVVKRNSFEHKAYSSMGILLINHYVLSFFQKV